MNKARLLESTAISTVGKKMSNLRNWLNTPLPVLNRVTRGQALAATGAAAGLAKAHSYMLDRAKEEYDPIETTLDGLEKYVLDPIDEVSGSSLAVAAGLGLGGLGAYQGYKHREALREAILGKAKNEA